MAETDKHPAQMAVLPRELGQVPPSPALVGPKAAHLSELLVLKARVPRFGVVSVHAFDALRAMPEVERLLAQAAGDLDDEARRVAHGEALRRAIIAGTPSAEVERAIAEVVDAFTEEDLLAVRASPVGGVADQLALAGALDTQLYVRSPDAAEAVMQVFASALAPAALSARYEAGLAPLDARVAVVVQRMVKSEVSGVCATVDTDGGGDRMLVAATLGLSGGSSRGRGDRRIHDDRIRVARPLDAEQGLAPDAAVDMDVVEKQEAVRFDDEQGSGTRVVPVDDDKRSKPALSEAQTRVLATEALRLEARLGRPQRLVFTFAGRLLHLLEARPLLLPRAAHKSVRVRIWDRRLVPAGLSEPTTPLTYSLLRRAAARATFAAIPVLDVKRRALGGRRSATERLFGWLRGHAYLNVTAFEALLELLPAHEEAARAVAFGFGVPELIGARTTLLPKSEASAGDVSLGRVKKLHKKVTSEAQSYLAPARERVAATRSAILDELDPDRLLDHLDDVEEVLEKAGAQLALLSFVAALGYDAGLRTLLAGGLSEAQRTFNDLLAGEPDAAASGLLRAVVDLCALVDEEPVLDELFSSGGGAQAIYDRLEGLPQAQRLRARLSQALEEHGHDVIAALKAEAPSYRQRPDLLLALVRAARVQGVPEPRGLKSAALGLRKKAEFFVQGELKTRAGLALKSRGAQALEVAALVREVLALRAQTRDVVVRAADAARRVAFALGDRLFEHELLDQPADVFFLTAEEVRGLVRGTTIDAQPRALVAARKREASGFADAAGDRLETEGVVAVAVPIATQLPGDDGTAHTLHGIPISSGEQTGRAVVIGPRERRARGQSSFSPEAVIVTDRLEPGLLPAYVCARAVIVEGASVLDPVAVPLRAFGVPVVGGIARATEHVEPGEPLHVNGSEGRVHLVLRMPAEEQPALDLGDADHFARLAAPSDPEVTSLKARDASAPSAPREVSVARATPREVSVAPSAPREVSAINDEETTVADTAPEREDRHPPAPGARPEDRLPQRRRPATRVPPGPPPLTDPRALPSTDVEEEPTEVTSERGTPEDN